MEHKCADLEKSENLRGDLIKLCCDNLFYTIFDCHSAFLCEKNFPTLLNKILTRRLFQIITLLALHFIITDHFNWHDTVLTTKEVTTLG